MKLIPLTQGKFAQVDDEDYDFLSQRKWQVFVCKDIIYARSGEYTPKKRTILMHRLIMCARDGVIIDHKDRNGLNCQRSNLRESTKSQNCSNRKKKESSLTSFLGVHLVRRKYKSKKNGLIVYKNYIAKISSNKDKKQVYIGCFKTEEEAAKAYDAKAKEVHGEFANLNFKE